MAGTSAEGGGGAGGGSLRSRAGGAPPDRGYPRSAGPWWSCAPAQVCRESSSPDPGVTLLWLLLSSSVSMALQSHGPPSPSCACPGARGSLKPLGCLLSLRLPALVWGPKGEGGGLCVTPHILLPGLEGPW